MAYATEKRIGFVSTRLAGNDGVSLESAKWAEILWEDKHVSHWYAGLLDRAPSVSFCAPEAHFTHSENEWINQRIWGTTRRSPLVSHRIREMAEYLKSTLYKFVETYDIDVLIPQNVLTIPMHVPLGIALTEFITETQIPTISHNHDFYWERDRFAINAVQDYLDMAFPARNPAIRHAVINQQAQEQLSLRKGVSSLLVPNVFDFENHPPGIDEYTADVRQELGLSDSDMFILQPTRVVPRKGIEHAIKLVGMLNNPRCKLVISHEAGDEGFEYQNMLVELAREENVDLRFIWDRVSEYRHRDSKGRKMYTLGPVSACRSGHLPEHLRGLRQRLPRGPLLQDPDRGEPLFHLHPGHRAQGIPRPDDQRFRDEQEFGRGEPGAVGPRLPSGNGRIQLRDCPPLLQLQHGA